VVIQGTIENTGQTSFSGINLNASIRKNGANIIIPVTINPTQITALGPGNTQPIKLMFTLPDQELSFYEVIVGINSAIPVYTTQGKLLITYVGKAGSNVLKVVAFTSGLITDHPECLELKDMITQAQADFNKGNVQLALQEANQAVEACKNYLQSPLKPILSQKTYDRIPLYLGIGITAAILFGIIFNFYRNYRFRRRR
jgi:hypothetical protein